MRNRLVHILVVLFIVFINIGCDQQTKQYAQTHLEDYSVNSYMNDVFRLQYAENTGAFLSWGSDLPETWHFIFLKVFPVIMLFGMLVYVLFSRGVDAMQAIGLSFVIGGGLSNLYDRINYGMVVDFMNMGIGNIRTGIFNFADVAIMIGIGILLVTNFKK